MNSRYCYQSVVCSLSVAKSIRSRDAAFLETIASSFHFVTREYEFDAEMLRRPMFRELTKHYTDSTQSGGGETLANVQFRHYAFPTSSIKCHRNSITRDPFLPAQLTAYTAKAACRKGINSSNPYIR
jgi:hypothetical protein